MADKAYSWSFSKALASICLTLSFDIISHESGWSLGSFIGIDESGHLS